jgi:methionyl aminopeptidase
MIHYKSPEELITMREAGRIVARIHTAVREAIKPGVTTASLDKIAHDIIRRHNAIPTFLGYPPGGKYPYPAATIVCINEELVHGIPSPSRIIHEGDIVTLDVAVTYKGFVADAAFTTGVGKIAPEAQKMIEDAEAALMAAIKTARIGFETRDVSLTVQRYAEARGYQVIRDYTGHGVGRSMHEEPQVPNWWPKDRKSGHRWYSYPLKPGMTFAIEPMITMGKTTQTRTLDDHWTVVMADGALCCHVEHSIAITEGEPLILTLP